MDRYTATRLALRICMLAMSVSPARGQEQESVQVGELMVTQAADGVTVTLARDPSAQAMPDRPGQLPRSTVTRITLTSGELPSSPQPYIQPQLRSRPLPPLPAPRTHDMERDVQTLKAARAAMELDDQMHVRRIAALR